MARDKSNNNEQPIRLQKALADVGLASRRQIESWISDGRVQVDGEVATLGQRVTQSQKIRVDGREISRRRVGAPRILVMNKKVGAEVSRKPAGDRSSVFDDLPRLPVGRWLSVGRLDVSTSGLLLFTNDGDLANKLEHPSSNIDREYAVRIKAHLDDDQLNELRKGVVVDGNLCRFSDIQHYGGSGANHWYHVCLLEGRNREVRRIFESRNILVSRLKRVRFGPFVLPGFIHYGRTFEVHSDEVNAIRRMLNMGVSQRTGASAQSTKPSRSVLIEFPNLQLPNWVKQRD